MKYQAKAQVDYVGASIGAGSFKKGDIVEILSLSKSGWIDGIINGSRNCNEI